MTKDAKEKLMVAVACAIVLTLYVFGGMAIYYFFNTWERRAQFGEMFGAISTLFSGLAFAGLIVTLLLQQHGLVLQREESSRSARAQEEAARALAEQMKMQVLASRLNALSTLLGSVNVRIHLMETDNRSQGGRGGWVMTDVESERRKLEGEIEQVLASLQTRDPLLGSSPIV